RRGALAERSREGLDADLAHAESLEHRPDDDLGPDERAGGDEVQLRDHVLADELEAAAHVTVTALEQEPDDAVVHVGDEDPPSAVALRVTEGDDEVVAIAQAQELPQVIHLVLVVAVREADPFVARGFEAAAQGLPVPEVAGMVDDAHV